MSKQTNETLLDPLTPVRLEAESIKELEGKILTIIDATTPNEVQRKAIKDVARSAIWSWGSSWQMGFTREQWDRNHVDGVVNE